MKHTTKLVIDCHYYDCPNKPLNSYMYYLEDTNPIVYAIILSLMDGPSCNICPICGFSSYRDDLMIMDIESTLPIHFNSSLINMLFGNFKNIIDLYMVTIGRDRNYELTNLWDNKTIKISSNSHKFNALFSILCEDWGQLLLDNRTITAERRRCAILDHIHPILDYMNSSDYNKELCWVA